MRAWRNAPRHHRRALDQWFGRRVDRQHLGQRLCRRRRRLLDRVLDLTGRELREKVHKVGAQDPRAPTRLDRAQLAGAQPNIQLRTRSWDYAQGTFDRIGERFDVGNVSSRSHSVRSQRRPERLRKTKAETFIRSERVWRSWPFEWETNGSDPNVAAAIRDARRFRLRMTRPKHGRLNLRYCLSFQACRRALGFEASPPAARLPSGGRRGHSFVLTLETFESRRMAFERQTNVRVEAITQRA